MTLQRPPAWSGSASGSRYSATNSVGRFIKSGYRSHSLLVAVSSSSAHDGPAGPPGALIVEAPSFAALYRDQARYVFRVLRRLGVAAKDVEDVCQDVFVVVHRKLPEFAHRSTIRTWLYGIALRCASDYRRRAHVVREVSGALENHEPTVGADQPQAVAHRQARALLDRIIEELDDDKRAVFVLFELEELTMVEVAEVVGCPLQTAYSRLYAARSAVEAAMARFTGGQSRRANRCGGPIRARVRPTRSAERSIPQSVTSRRQHSSSASRRS
ncbi:MAG: RNA polymerase sigma factor [Deltaproteobacteria bacterium]|nr:RNA polymerase sigma factor [Deltaproteobacteria bacterium]